MTSSNGARRRSNTIEQDFDDLFRYMRSKRFRNGEDTGGEPADYIYAYPPEKELAVSRHVAQLARRLEGMEPVDADDVAPSVLTIDMYELVIQLMKDDDVFDSVIEQEPDMHVESDYVADEDDAGSMPWPKLDEDDFYQALASMLDPDSDGVKDALRERYGRAAANREADLVFITGVGKVYPYIRAHALLSCLQDVMPERTPVVVFFPGTYEKTATTVSVMRLFDRLGADNYYRAFSLNTVIVEGVGA